MVEKNEIINALREVYDPEIPINVYDLGLIYEINIKENNNVHILMSLTSPTCPTADYIQEIIHDAVASIEGVNSVDVELTFDPLWTPDRVSQEAKEELGLVENNNDNSISNIFSNNSSQEIDNLNFKDDGENVCFNCSVTDDKLPLLDCIYKGEKLKICSKCLIKFNNE